jgi:hypothetical protein
MGFRLKKAQTLALKTRDEVIELAAKLKGYGGTECERQEKEGRKEKIRAKIFGGEMRPFTWAIGEVVGGPHKGLIRRVDGQHSSEVFLEMTTEDWSRVPFPVVAVWEHYECDDIIDMAVLFEQFNPSWSSRSSEDLVGAHVQIHEDLRDLKDRFVLDKVTKGMAWYARGVLGLDKASTRQFMIVHDNHDTHAFLLWCGSFLQKGKTNEMLHPATVGAMRHMFDAENPDPSEFWKRVATGGKTQNEEGSPEYKLADFLAGIADPVNADWPKSVAKHFGKSARPADNQVFATCLNAFTGSHAGKRMGDIFVPVKKGQRLKEIAAQYPRPLPPEPEQQVDATPRGGRSRPSLDL